MTIFNINRKLLVFNIDKSSLYFLIFILLITSGRIHLMILGLIFMCLVNIKTTRFIQFSKFHIFYLFFIFYSLINGIIYFLFDSDITYIYKLSLGLFIWIIGYLFSIQIVTFIRKIDEKRIFTTLKNFFFIQIIMCVSQFIYLFIRYEHINPFSVTASAGDHIKGTFTNSSVAQIIFFFFSVYFFYKKSKKYALLACIMALCTTYMGGILIACVSVIIFFLSTRFKFIYRVRFIFIFSIFVYLFYIFNSLNVQYAQRTLKLVLLNPPRKILAFYDLYNYLSKYPTNFFFGAGTGNFSSREAFVAGGEYVNWYPDNLIHKSKVFEHYHFSLWNHNILSTPYSDGTANQPFATYNRILGEYGLVGFLIFFFTYIFYFIRRVNRLTYGRLMLISIFAFWILDYWFEYFSVMIFFELFLVLDIKEKKINE